MFGMKKGVFITFEGNEGSGKSSHVASLVGSLQTAGYEVVSCRDPGATAYGEYLRPALKGWNPEIQLSRNAEFLAFCSVRAQMIHELIKPALSRGAIVISDRFMDSTLVYQCIVGGVPLSLYSAVHDALFKDLEIDCTFYIEVPLDVATARTGRREGSADKFDRDLENRRRVQAGYEDYIKLLKRVKTIDGDRKMSEVKSDILAHTNHILDTAYAN